VQGGALSGIAGILNLDGSPVDRDRLKAMAQFLAFRGPNRQQVWVDGAVGLGHALLASALEAEGEQQPANFDGDTWITADARVDARGELIQKLRAAGRVVPRESTDTQLILYAYHVWGVSCVDHILGDFVFAIWHRSAGRLFCARDQFGIKPFFYARVGASLVFSNVLECTRLHPAVSDALNNLAIADFLLFDFPQDVESTAFRDIHRLPPAHTLEVTNGNISTHRYWTLPAPAPIRPNRKDECVEHFLELLDGAVSDRLRADFAGVLMSGGLDSTKVAASARRVLSRRGRASCLRAYTEVYDHLIPHEERYYASLAAKYLQIPIEFRSADDCTLFDRWGVTRHRYPEPVHWLWGASTLGQLRQMAFQCRVALTGLGADPGLSCFLSEHFRNLLTKKQYGRALADAMRYLTAEGRLSRLYLRTRWRLWFKPQGQLPSYPGWLNEDLEKRLDLRDRWESMNRPASTVAAVRPEAYEAITSKDWPNLFEFYDAGVTRVPIEVVHPFFDIRLVSFLLSLPALPWCSDKQLLREPESDALPAEIRNRRKSPLLADPLVALLKQPDSGWVDRFKPVPELEPFVCRERIPKVMGETDSWTAWINLRPLSLNNWLHSRSALSYKCLAEKPTSEPKTRNPA